MDGLNFFAGQLDQSACALDPARVVDELTYRSYAYNRDRSPHVTPDEWRRVFGNRVPLLELRYQADRLLVAAGNRPTGWTEEDELCAAAEWTNNGPGYGEE